MSQPFIQRILELSDLNEHQLVDCAFEEFKRLSLQDSGDTISLKDIEHGYAVLALALGWVERPKIHTRTLSDAVQLRDGIG